MNTYIYRNCLKELIITNSIRPLQKMVLLLHNPCLLRNSCPLLLALQARSCLSKKENIRLYIILGYPIRSGTAKKSNRQTALHYWRSKRYNY